MSADADDLVEISRAHGQVGSYNTGHWKKLILAHGLAKVLAACDEHWMDNGKAATGSDAEKILGGSTACRPSRPIEDGDETPAWQPTAAPVTPKPSPAPAATTPPPAPAIPAAVETDRSPTAPAAGEEPAPPARTAAASRPWGLKPSTEPPKEIAMPSKNDQLVKRIKDRITADTLTMTAAATAIGCSVSGLSLALSGSSQIGPRMLPKVEAWLNGSAAPAADKPAAAKVAEPEGGGCARAA